jgi:16S rRNA (adenine1518-N6/adenine1519-N6)-dimethyltransferase
MLQKEVVDRMAAAPGSKAFGRLTIMLGCHMHVDPLFEVPPAAFDPAPKVVSAVVRLSPLPENHNRIEQWATHSRIVSQAFTQRRKTIRNALRAYAGDADLRGAGIDPGARAEQVPIAAWVTLANLLGEE